MLSSLNIPTHIVIDVADGFVFSRDSEGHHFTEHTATHFANLRNSELSEERRTYVVASVSPMLSRELIAAAIRAEAPPQLESGKVCISCDAPMGEPHRDDCVTRTGTLRRE